MKKFGLFIAAFAIFATGVYFAKWSENPNATDAASAAFEAAPTEPIAGDREPAAFTGAADQQRIVDEMNRTILAMKSKADVLPTVQKIVALAKQDTGAQFPAVQMYAAVASAVPDLEGIFYRCREFVETSDWLHMSWLFGLRDFAYNNYLYGPHIKALFEFVTYPSHRVGQPFKSVSELQDYALNNFVPKLQRFSALLTNLEKLPSQNFEFQFDRTILVGNGPGLRYLDPSEAKKLFIKPYIYTIHFLLERVIGSLYYVSAMDLDEMPIVFNRVIRQTTINSFTGDLRLTTPAKGVTPSMTYEIIKKTRSFLGWRSNIVIGGQRVDAQQLLDRAFNSGVNSAYLQLAAYVCAVKYPVARAKGQIMEIDVKRDCLSFDQENASAFFVPNGGNFLFNPNVITDDFKEKYHMFRDRSRAYAEAKAGRYAAITSDVTGQTIRVNVKAFFNAAHSQRDFLPTGYTAGNPSAPVPGLSGVSAWNYNYGQPMTFKDYTFGGFFDPAQVKDPGTLYRTMATVLYTKAIAPFAIFIRVPSTAQFFLSPAEAVRN